MVEAETTTARFKRGCPWPELFGNCTIFSSYDLYKAARLPTRTLNLNVGGRSASFFDRQRLVPSPSNSARKSSSQVTNALRVSLLIGAESRAVESQSRPSAHLDGGINELVTVRLGGESRQFFSDVVGRGCIRHTAKALFRVVSKRNAHRMMRFTPRNQARHLCNLVFIC